MTPPKLKVAYRVWLVSDGKAFGKGPYDLLKGIEKTGSLRQSAMRMRMSYRKAWGLLKDCEKRLGFTLIERKVGGSRGGYSKITAQGETFLRSYETFCSEVKESIEQIFQKHMNAFLRRRKVG
jgi:molybdate transport system regulatory protein